MISLSPPRPGSYLDDLGISYQEYSAATTYASVRRSADRLRRVLDVVHIHDVEQEDLEQIFASDGALHALVELRRQGEIRSVGMATWDLDCLLAAVDSDAFDHVQFCHSYTLLNQTAADYDELAARPNSGAERFRIGSRERAVSRNAKPIGDLNPMAAGDSCLGFCLRRTI